MRLLLTGADGFTGRHLSDAATGAGYTVLPLKADLTDSAALAAEVLELKPTHVVHLAAISSVTHADEAAFYGINVFGTLNLLKALEALPSPPQKVVLASSANVYGNYEGAAITEMVCPKPVNHYAMSKLAMEHMALTYVNRLPIVIARPFNYTGVWHDQRFVIPKIVDHFARRASGIELGNLEVWREYNDVRFVCQAYLALLALGVVGEIYNVCTGKMFNLTEIIERLAVITGHQIQVSTNPEFVRPNEIKYLCGNSQKLQDLVGRPMDIPDINETLQLMLEAN